MSEEFAPAKMPRALMWKRLHSLAGLWIVLFLMEHLLVNSQAALFLGADGAGFIESANSIHGLPYLPIIEMLLLGVPIAIHTIWGIQYLFSAKYNSSPTDGSTPAITDNPRNHAYTWQRITSWLLVIGIVLHVIHMRFVEFPTDAQLGSAKEYMVRLNDDSGLYTLAERLNFKIYNAQEIQKFKEESSTEQKTSNDKNISDSTILSNTQQQALHTQLANQRSKWIKALEYKPLKNGQVIAISQNFGTAELLMVRDTFKMPIMLVLYTILVLSACFHAFNGLSTFLFAWGITITNRSQRMMTYFSSGLMIIFTFLGLAAIWGTYWFNLKQ